MVVAAGCGGDNVHHLNDGGADAPTIADAAPDAPPAPGLVTVAVTEAGSGVENVVVYFLNADSTVVLEAMTDANGSASTTMAPGGSVTLLQPQIATVINGGGGTTVAVPGEAPPPPIDNQLLITWEGVKPGDNLRDDLDPVNVTDIATFNLTVPTDNTVGVQTYTLFTTCDNGFEGQDITPPVTLREHASPHDVSDNAPIQVTLENCGSAADLLVETEDLNGTVLTSLFAPATAIANGSDVTLAAAYVAVPGVPVTVSDVPPEFGDAELDMFLVTSRNLLSAFGVDPGVTAGSGAATLGVPALGSDVTEATEIDLFPASANIIDTQLITSWGPQVTTLDFDVGSNRLRSWVTPEEVDTVDGIVTWSLGSAGGTPDYVVTFVEDRRPNPNTQANNWTWAIIAPGDSDGQVVAPVLPTDVFDFNWHDTDQTFVDATVAAQTPGGYDAARGLIIDSFGNVLDEPALLALTLPTGQVAVQEHEPRDVASTALAHHAKAKAKALTRSRRISRNGKVAR